MSSPESCPRLLLTRRIGPKRSRTAAPHYGNFENFVTLAGGRCA